MNLQDLKPESTLSNQHKNVEKNAQAPQENHIVTLTSPRPWILESLIIFSTFNIAASFWMLFRISELKKITKINFTPWLWFFVPLLFFAQLFALPKFTKTIEETEIKNGILPNKKSSITWITLVAIFSLYFNISSKIEFPFYFDIACLAIVSMLFGFYHRRVTRLLAAIPNVKFKNRNFYLVILDWSIIVTLIPIITWLTYDLSIKPLLIEPVRVFKKGEIFVDQDNGYQLTLTGDGWEKIPIGSYSDGSSMHEFKGPNENMYFVIFEQNTSSLDDITYWRIEEIKSGLPSAKCSHKRYFEDESIDVVALVKCENKGLSENSIIVTKSIKISARAFEIYGYFSSVNNTFNNNKTVFINTAKEFRSIK